MYNKPYFWIFYHCGISNERHWQSDTLLYNLFLDLFHFIIHNFVSRLRLINLCNRSDVVNVKFLFTFLCVISKYFIKNVMAFGHSPDVTESEMHCFLLTIATLQCLKKVEALIAFVEILQDERFRPRFLCSGNIS